MLDLTNEQRALGVNCGVYGYQPAVGPLEMEPHLRCAARVHALDMLTRGYFDHDSPGGPLGDSFDQRIITAGYSGGAMGENIAYGYASPQSVVQGWLASDGHCQNMMSDWFSDLGVGYASLPGSEYDPTWVQDFGG